ncbi:TetR family transcriptional regulator [Galbitalea soli]|uniref:TetR family transcriptional regulator n=1 Tax=Galbitalea soli TaxID=1268042 RepID=A0A7C9PMQ8_9MICO|nr:TetR family transcriptional regulator [Galbitalea soli]NEM90951.1 TetR family transcriptional regulator [Galbitalea soli]NYJ29638.1 AcrR family transcriptional regulator [Galbitalea soli]
MSETETGDHRLTRHSRDDVVTAALRILDDIGLADLSMRRLAASLGVQASALYWHFPNKQSLLASVSDRILDRARPIGPGDLAGDGQAGARPADRPPATGPGDSDSDGDGDGDGEWQAVTRAEARALRDALLAYRDSAELVSSTLALGLGADQAVTRLQAAIARGGFAPATAHAAAAALLHFLLGYVSHEQQRLQADSLGVVAPAARASAHENAPAAQDAPAAQGSPVPHETPPAEAGSAEARAALTGTAGFDFGVGLLLGGLEREPRLSAR